MPPIPGAFKTCEFCGNDKPWRAKGWIFVKRGQVYFCSDYCRTRQTEYFKNKALASVNLIKLLGANRK